MDLSDDTGLISTLTGKQTEDFFEKLHKNHWEKQQPKRHCRLASSSASRWL